MSLGESAGTKYLSNLMAQTTWTMWLLKFAVKILKRARNKACLHGYSLVYLSRSNSSPKSYGYWPPSYWSVGRSNILQKTLHWTFGFSNNMFFREVNVTYSVYSHECDLCFSSKIFRAGINFWRASSWWTAWLEILIVYCFRFKQNNPRSSGHCQQEASPAFLVPHLMWWVSLTDYRGKLENYE